MVRPSVSTPSRLSPSEQRLMALLRPAPTTTEELARQYFMRREKPFNARQIISNLVRSLEAKTKRARPSVKRTPRAGPKSTEVWVE